jgi:hypothetical protein
MRFGDSLTFREITSPESLRRKPKKISTEAGFRPNPTDFVHDLLFNPEGGADMFLQNIRLS